MKNCTLIILSIILFGLISCGSKPKPENEVSKRCSKYLKAGKFERLLFENHKLVLKGDTLNFNEMKFECTVSAYTTQKLMFDNFGKWDKANFFDKTTIPILVWDKVDLFKNGQLYMVMATGQESFETIYGSVIVIDRNSKDVLISSESKDKFSNYFESLIKTNDWSDKEFINLFNETRTTYYNSNIFK